MAEGILNYIKTTNELFTVNVQAGADMNSDLMQEKMKESVGKMLSDLADCPRIGSSTGMECRRLPCIFKCGGKADSLEHHIRGGPFWTVLLCVIDGHTNLLNAPPAQRTVSLILGSRVSRGVWWPFKHVMRLVIITMVNFFSGC